ncbi:uncharacterized protein SPPG_00115 [Spizellomyces punctatus DAOM BR117]|uniref:C2 domain-containing protein n=1 Tax=Spizellomyces punctatus (strain DAOM BR117) TaxID=645134 RepID=A0A0L0HU30_SPIPD|nr:uncharacterized protein SPPG_00115 [Spizellomyces punctatus DAOM BR117]KND04384.1 hypothetical protein SPPG_00115 [Spizellomyces punctatus DAOM BR117]|eukprot:XP_016612423.1 hypothetical protein SPPG_00115 [Spizellomyces punctatus DAOM BR117]
MDRATELTDAFVEVKFADYEEYRTQIYRRSLNPIWNEDFRFEVSNDADLQNEPLELKVMDYDQITYNDSIGTVFIDLNPLLTWDSMAQISGWIPIFDTLRGARGELNVQVRLQFFGDVNPFKDSSAGVQFYTMTSLPPNVNVVAVLGFVSALDNEDDPEYHWSDNFRTPRTSNESRTRVMYRLSGQLRRQLGKKVLELNGNAVVGFKQCFDIESEERAITARAIGTAVRLSVPDQVSLDRGQSWSSMQTPGASPLNTPFSEHLPSVSPLASGMATTAKATLTPEELSENGSSFLEEQPSALLVASAATGYKSAEHMTLTLHNFPTGAILGIGGLISATSVKVIENDSKDIREAWWTELRDEIKSHARALGCPFVIGYSENTSISDELAVLHCSGTAAILDLSVMNSFSGTAHSSRMNSVTGWEPRGDEAVGSVTQSAPVHRTSISGSEYRESFLEAFARRKRKRKRAKGCQACHITYRREESPFPMSYAKCGVCKKKHVPEVLLTTIEPPSELDTVGNGILLEAHVCRYRKTHGDSRPSVVSESIPFAQYDIHRQLMYKLRIYGLNAVFGLKIQYSVGESLMTAVATGTAVFVRALPPPPAMKVFRNLDVVDEEDKKLLEIQRKIMLRSESNRKMIEQALSQLDLNDDCGAQQAGESDQVAKSETDSGSESDSDSEDEQEFRRHRSVVVQIDDEQDEDLVLMQDPSFPDDFQMCNTGVAPKSDTLFQPHNLYHIQMVSIVKHAAISVVSHHPNRQLADIFKNLYQELVFQLAYFKPCIVGGLNYDVQLIKDNEIQIALTGIALGQIVQQGDPVDVQASNESFALGDSLKKVPGPARAPTKVSLVSQSSTHSLEDGMVFSLEDDQETDTDPNRPSSHTSHSTPPSVNDPPTRPSTPTALHLSLTLTDNPFIDITPLWYIPNTRLTRFLGRISLHFVKEAAMVFELGTGNTGMGGFTHTFLVEMYAICRAHAFALGGNALVAFRMDQIVFEESLKNQAYALVSVGGDVVEVESWRGRVGGLVSVLG